MIKFFKFLIPGLAASLIGLISLPAQAIVVIQPPPASTIFYFSGNCEDCASRLDPSSHLIRARLELRNYYQGADIYAPNFVSFAYEGSDMIVPYSILSSPSLVVSGNIVFSSPSTNVFHVADVSHYFDLFRFQRWDTGIGSRSFDTGGSGGFSPNAVPEPGTMLLMGAALAAAGLARRRRQR